MVWEIIPRAEADVASLLKSINKVVINPLIIFLFAVAMVYFLYGLAQYLLSKDNEEVRKKSKSIMLWGLIGLFIMVSVFQIMRIILNTVGEDKIKINSNGDYVVDGGKLANNPIKDSAKSNQDVTKGLIDSSTGDVPELDPAEFTTDPFPTYEANSLCWRSTPPTYGTAKTEYEATQKARSTARVNYLFNTGIPVDDKAYLSYPTAFDMKVLYDKKNKTYHAWIDSRGPMKGAKISSCNLKVLKPARTLKDNSIVVTISAQNTPDNLPADAFTADPFPQYSANALCWHFPVHNVPAQTEYDALQQVRDGARKKFLDETGVSPDDANNKKYPLVYDTKVLYDKVKEVYYYWIDARAPLLASGGKEADCNLDMIGPARTISDGATLLDVSIQNIPQRSAQAYITIPFGKFEQSNKCWQNQFYKTGATEYEATKAVKTEARALYIKETGINPADKTYQIYPSFFDSKLMYDKANKTYYSWVDARGPKNGGDIAECNLKMIAPPQVLADRKNMSIRKDPFGTKYTSDATYYRIHDSASMFTYTDARNTAINNALIQVANIKGLNSINGIKYRILGELYFPKKTDYDNYEYWIAIESPK